MIPKTYLIDIIQLLSPINIYGLSKAASQRLAIEPYIAEFVYSSTTN